MKKYIFLLAMAVMAFQFQACSNSDDAPATVNEPQQEALSVDKIKAGLLPTLTRAEILDGILSGEITSIKRVRLTLLWFPFLALFLQ